MGGPPRHIRCRRVGVAERVFAWALDTTEEGLLWTVRGSAGTDDDPSKRQRAELGQCQNCLCAPLTTVEMGCFSDHS